MEPLVSIVIPIYKVEEYIDKCVETIINQSYKNLEIILVNDGSPDNCGDIADNYAQVDSRIKVIHKENGGLSDARNAGLEYATGEYICFIDSDDYVESDMVESSLTKAIETDADVVIFSLYNEVVNENDSIIKREAVSLDSKNVSSIISLIGYAWNKLYKTSFLKFNKLTFQKGLSLVEDIVFNEQVLRYTNKIEYINKPLYHYISRNRPTLVKQYHYNSYKLHKLGFFSRKKVILKLFDLNLEIQQILARSHIGGIRYCCSNMFYFRNSLTKMDKYKNIKIMINDKVTSEEIAFFQPKNLNDIIIKLVIRYKASLGLFLIYYIRSLFISFKKAGV